MAGSRKIVNVGTASSPLYVNYQENYIFSGLSTRSAPQGLETSNLPDCVSHPSTGEIYNITKELKDPAWVERLRKGDLIYLIKENSVGQVAWEWGARLQTRLFR